MRTKANMFSGKATQGRQLRPRQVCCASPGCREMLAPLLLGSLALHPAACVQRHSLRSAPAPAAARPYGLPPPLLQPTTHERRRVPSPCMVSAEFAAPLIDLGVRVDTFLPQFAWLLIVALPRAKLTERIMGPIGPIVALSLIHLAIVLCAEANTSPSPSPSLAYALHPHLAIVLHATQGSHPGRRGLLLTRSGPALGQASRHLARRDGADPHLR